MNCFIAMEVSTRNWRCFNNPQWSMGASELMLAIRWENGKHARKTIGVNELPCGTPVRSSS